MWTDVLIEGRPLSTLKLQLSLSLLLPPPLFRIHSITDSNSSLSNCSADFIRDFRYCGPMRDSRANSRA